MICRKRVRPSGLLDRDMVPTLSPCPEYGFSKRVRHVLIHDIMRRLEAERDLARRAVNGDMAALHEELASLYEKMINALEPPAETACFTICRELDTDRAVSGLTLVPPVVLPPDTTQPCQGG